MLGTESRVLGPQTRATPKGGTGVNGGLRPQAVRLTPAWPGEPVPLSCSPSELIAAPWPLRGPCEEWGRPSGGAG